MKLSYLRRLIVFSLCSCLVAAWPSPSSAERRLPAIPAMVADRLAMGIAQDLIVLFDDRDVEAEAAAQRQQARAVFDDDGILAHRRTRYRSIKQATLANVTSMDAVELRDFDQLPLSLYRIKSRPALDRLLADPRVLAVYEDRPVYHHLTSSLPFIGQPTVANAGITGSGQTVAVIDTGIDYTLTAFGSCSAPGTPAGCRVAASVDVTGHNVTLNQTASNHGTNVSGIVAGVAPGARIASVNAFFNGSSSSSWVIAGINWAIANRSAYTISAVNMSLGDGSNNTTPCGNSFSNPFVTPINNLRNAGIMPVASSGNNAFTDGISNPACVPGVVSVGAVYDANIGGLGYGSCTDTTSAADKVACFSNSASFLTMLAPGAQINAAGITMYGTSQAAPHVAGALAVTRAAIPGDTLDQTVARLTANGVSISDSRNGVTIPRLNLLASLDAAAPTVSLTAPASGSPVSGTVTLAASASDVIGVSRVEFFVNGALAGSDTTVPYSFNWDTTMVTNGNYTLSARAYNAAGKIGQSADVSVTVANDTTPPDVVLTAPASGATVSGVVTVSSDASDNVGVSRVEFHVNDVLTATDTSAPYSFSWDTTTVTNGNYTLTVRAYDAAGNMGQSGSVNVTVSEPAAVPVFSPWVIAVAAACLAGLAGSRKRGRAGRGPGRQ